MNKFNRTWCAEHKCRRLSTSHLKEHGITLNYDIIENTIRSNNWEKIKEIINDLRNLENNKNIYIKENQIQMNESKAENKIDNTHV